MQQIDIQLFVSPFVLLAYIFAASYSTLVTSVSKKYGPIRTREITEIRLLHELYVEVTYGSCS